jgi:hypothetical protein
VHGEASLGYRILVDCCLTGRLAALVAHLAMGFASSTNTMKIFQTLRRLLDHELVSVRGRSWVWTGATATAAAVLARLG